MHMWASSIVREGSVEMPPFPSAPDGLEGDALAGWADGARQSLLDTLASADPEQPVWTMAGTGPARFWWRRQCHETAIHAWDATAAAGGGPASGWPIPSDVADDGLDEFLFFLERILRRGGVDWGEGKTVHLHRTDGEGERLIRIASPPEITAGHAKGDLAVRGPATDLWLWVMNRGGDVELFGDTALADAWREHVKI